MGSRDITSLVVAQTTDDTGLVPGGVIAMRPWAGETLPGEGPAPLADRPQAETASADAVATAMIGNKLRL
jgi:hypothetical protein